jgi:uncharacterized protein YndB with AHSA1/START domain
MAGTSSGKLKVTRTSDTTFVMSRVFDAPRHLVFETMTKPEYVRRWWCCMEGFTMPVCEIDLRVGGKWRYVMVGADGSEVAFNGEYREIDPPKRIVATEIFEPFPDHPPLTTMTLEERDGKTYYQTVVEHDSRESCDAHLASGMEVGANIALDRLEEVARGLTTTAAAGSTATGSPAPGTSGGPARREI